MSDAIKRCIELLETTMSTAIPDVPGSFVKIRRKFPSSISGVVDKLRRKNKRKLRKFSKLGPPLPPRI